MSFLFFKTNEGQHFLFANFSLALCSVLLTPSVTPVRLGEVEGTASVEVEELLSVQYYRSGLECPSQSTS